MSTRRPTLLLAVSASLLAAMVAATPVAATTPADQGVRRPLTVMTRNLDAGTDYGPSFAATTPTEFIQAATTEWQEIVASDIPERAAGIAAEIAATLPDVVSLQEATLFRTGPLYFDGGLHATAVAYDQLGSLMSSLAADGVRYRVVGELDEFDVEVPTFLGFDVRATDREAMLVRADLSPTVLSVANVMAGHYATLLTAPTAVGAITIPRGWISADVTSLGRTTRVIGTHLEPLESAGPDPTAVADAQAEELLAGPAATDLPVVLAGDFNTGPGVSPTYDVLIGGGLTDTWTATEPGDPGYTLPLHHEDPADASATPSVRIDLVLERGLVPKTDVIVGDTPADLTPSGLWPSDHAGVVATLRLAGPGPG
jgi:endonuclease/exonuclease/phosphatase family metal-dependent hydrolase